MDLWKLRAEDLKVDRFGKNVQIAKYLIFWIKKKLLNELE